jgi:hypothetical protein
LLCSNAKRICAPGAGQVLEDFHSHFAAATTALQAALRAHNIWLSCSFDLLIVLEALFCNTKHLQLQQAPIATAAARSARGTMPFGATDFKTHVIRCSTERLQELIPAATYHREGSMKQIWATALLRKHATCAYKECDAIDMVANDPDCLPEWCVSAMLGYMCITENNRVTFSEMNRTRFKVRRARYDLVEKCTIGDTAELGPDKNAVDGLKLASDQKIFDSATLLSLSLTCKALHHFSHQQLLDEDKALVELCERLPRSEGQKFHKWPQATWRRKQIGQTLFAQAGCVRGSRGVQPREHVQYERLLDRVKMRKLSMVFGTPAAAVHHMCSFVKQRPTFCEMWFPPQVHLREFSWSQHFWPGTVRRHSYSFQEYSGGPLAQLPGRAVMARPEYTEPMKVIRVAVEEEQCLAIAFVRNEKKQKKAQQAKRNGREPVKEPTEKRKKKHKTNKERKAAKQEAKRLQEEEQAKERAEEQERARERSEWFRSTAGFDRARQRGNFDGMKFGGGAGGSRGSGRGSSSSSSSRAFNNTSGNNFRALVAAVASDSDSDDGVQGAEDMNYGEYSSSEQQYNKRKRSDSPTYGNSSSSSGGAPYKRPATGDPKNPLELLMAAVHMADTSRAAHSNSNSNQESEQQGDGDDRYASDGYESDGYEPVEPPEQWQQQEQQYGSGNGSEMHQYGGGGSSKRKRDLSEADVRGNYKRSQQQQQEQSSEESGCDEDDDL